MSILQGTPLLFGLGKVVFPSPILISRINVSAIYSPNFLVFQQKPTFYAIRSLTIEFRFVDDMTQVQLI